MITIPVLILRGYAALLGAVVGSFLTTCIHRWPMGGSVTTPRSHCPHCTATIEWHDNIPILSYLILRGRCRVCDQRISPLYPLVELTTSLIWLGTVVHLGGGFEALRISIFLTLLLGIALTDARHLVIPVYFSLGGMVLGILLALTTTGLGELIDPNQFSSGVRYWALHLLTSEAPPVYRALTGALIGYVLMRFVGWGGERLFRKPALGMGDVQMMALVGAFLGPAGALLTIMIGASLGLLIGVPVTWLRRGSIQLGSTYLPLGTFLAIAAALTNAWGDDFISWYMSW